MGASSRLLAVVPSAPWAEYLKCRRANEPDMPVEKMRRCSDCEHVTPVNGLSPICVDCGIQRAYFRWLPRVRYLNPWFSLARRLFGYRPRVYFFVGPGRRQIVPAPGTEDSDSNDGVARGVLNLDAEDGFADLDAGVFDNGVTFRHTDKRTGGGLHNLHRPLPGESRETLREEIEFFRQTGRLHPRAVSQQ